MTSTAFSTVFRNSKAQGIQLSDRWRSWHATQPWLAETVRATAAGAYAELIRSDEGDTRGGIHRNAINAHVSKAFGALLDSNRPDLSIVGTVDLLLRFGDLADIHEGYLIPRESRIVVFSSGWARIAGGLPLASIEYADIGIANLSSSTTGRIVATNEPFDRAAPDIEHSEVLCWTKKEPDELLANLSNQLPERPSLEPSEGSVRFYHARLKSSRTRRDRWQIEPPKELFSVARTAMAPVHYFVHFAANPTRSRWFSVKRDEARKWLLLAERQFLTTNLIYAEENDGQVRAKLPDMLPDSWTVALLSCGSTVISTETGWDVIVPADVLPLFQLMLKAANLRI